MTSPLIDRLTQEFGYPTLDASNYDDFIANNETVALFFANDPAKFPETLDLAVILPELHKAFKDRFTPAVIDRSYEKELQQRFDFKAWPALVFLRDGQYLGNTTRIQDWSDYMSDIPAILDAMPSRNPGLGIPVVTEFGAQS